MSLHLSQIQAIANTPKSAILIQGETGTGKSHLAKSIHDQSNYNKFPFISIDLACVKEDLMESELFGHKKGSFTSAHTDKEGLINQVSLGTLFLDEIGELSLEAQKKLLFLIEERCFRPLGSNKFIPFQGHLIAATNINLLEKVKKREFREDLYYRLNIFQYNTIPLRKNISTILPLTNEFLFHFSQKYQKSNIQVNLEMIKILEEYPWPGNIRELKNALEYLVAIFDNTKNIEYFLPDHIAQWNPGNKTVNDSDTPIDGMPFIEIGKLPSNFSKALDIFEQKYLGHFLRLNNFRINKTAKDLNISKTTLIYKRNKYGLKL